MNGKETISDVSGDMVGKIRGGVVGRRIRKFTPACPTKTERKKAGAVKAEGMNSQGTKEVAGQGKGMWGMVMMRVLHSALEIRNTE